MAGQDSSKQRAGALGRTGMAGQAQTLGAPAARWPMAGAHEKAAGRENGRRMELSLRERIKKQEHSFKKKGKGDERRKWKNIYLKGLARENVN